MKLRILSMVLLAAVAASAQDSVPPAPVPQPATAPDSAATQDQNSVSSGKVAAQGHSWFGGIFGGGRGGSTASSRSGKTVPQGSSIPGLGGVGFMDGPGYFEAGGSRSDLTSPIQPWTDLYVRGVISPEERDFFNIDVERQARYGDAGWLYNLGATHVFTDFLYVDVNGTASRGGFFIPKYSVSTHVNYKTLPRKQLVLYGGLGLDQGKAINGFSTRASRLEAGTTYYFTNWPFIVQDGVTFTHADPGGVTAPSGYLAITEGHSKEHYITVRAELGREGYALFGNSHSQFTAFNFPIHNYTGTWRQWIGNNWGVNVVVERYVNPYFNRNGATIGLFLDF
jgi:YaiO family outer membrane protein